MEICEVRNFLLGCAGINMIVLLFYFVLMATAGDFVYRLHGKWFPMERTTFNAIHYCGVAVYKTVIFVFFLIPAIVLMIMER